MIVNEIFHSIQGEGVLAGVCSVFVRLAGCRHRCRWCDTAYARDGSAGREMSIEQIGQKVGSYNCSNIVITGGEPMANDSLAGLVGHLKKPGTHITIETSGRHYRDGIACDLMSISPKLANAGDNPTESQTVNKLISRYNYQLKFVIEARSDLAQVQAMVEALDDVERGKILLMPQCRSRDEYLARSSLVAEMCLETGYTFGQRLHVLLWNGLAGK